MRFSLSKWLYLVLALTLTACGGGGGGSSSGGTTSADTNATLPLAQTRYPVRKAFENLAKSTDEVRLAVSGTIEGVAVTGEIRVSNLSVTSVTDELPYTAYTHRTIDTRFLIVGGVSQPSTEETEGYLDEFYYPLSVSKSELESGLLEIERVQALPEYLVPGQSGTVYVLKHYSRVSTVNGEVVKTLDSTETESYTVESGPDNGVTVTFRFVTVAVDGSTRSVGYDRIWVGADGSVRYLSAEFQEGGSTTYFTPL